MLGSGLPAILCPRWRVSSCGQPPELSWMAASAAVRTAIAVA
jgi:hypothetical protein